MSVYMCVVSISSASGKESVHLKVSTRHKIVNCSRRQAFVHSARGICSGDVMQIILWLSAYCICFFLSIEGYAEFPFEEKVST